MNKEALNYIYLLGGQDIEMISIKDILIKQGIKEGTGFYDRNLSWGAKLSSYSDIIDNRHTWVGIELGKDIPTPLNYIEIDHHNENSTKKASLLQIAELLDIELTREQLLIAANDSGYIPAITEMNTSTEEINEIRRKDRAAQGVNEDDEINAEKSLSYNKQIINGIILIKSLTPHFSAVLDRLYPFEQAIIYNDFSLLYTGKNRDLLIPLFSNLLKEGKAFYGGNNKGFIGTARGKLSADEINELINVILKN